ncbi:hypothetical protein EG329_013684 [Mollisiaceae sp. DMI_Dod_QoI]|nr:hypothetical protein EG329_013684 [Helotiales sp. DMI_Dod_QoI]
MPLTKMQNTLKPVTLALCITGVVPVLRSVFIFISQILGAIAAAGVIRGLIPGNEILFNVKLAPGMSIPQGLFLEMFLTAELVFAILMLAAEKTKATFVAPVGIGLALFVAELVGVYWTGGALNPARAFGPAVIMGKFSGDHWIYWLGPVLGALLASGFYALIKYLNYEEVNGDQDKSQDEEKILDMAKRHRAGGHEASDQRNGPRVNGRGKASVIIRNIEGIMMIVLPDLDSRGEFEENVTEAGGYAYLSSGRPESHYPQTITKIALIS